MSPMLEGLNLKSISQKDLQLLADKAKAAGYLVDEATIRLELKRRENPTASTWPKFGQDWVR